MRAFAYENRGLTEAASRLRLVGRHFLRSDGKVRDFTCHRPDRGWDVRNRAGRLPLMELRLPRFVGKWRESWAMLLGGARRSPLTLKGFLTVTGKWRGSTPRLPDAARQLRRTLQTLPPAAGRLPLRLRRLPSDARNWPLRSSSSPSLAASSPATTGHRQFSHSPCLRLSRVSPPSTLPLHGPVG